MTKWLLHPCSWHHVGRIIEAALLLEEPYKIDLADIERQRLEYSNNTLLHDICSTEDEEMGLKLLEAFIVQVVRSLHLDKVKEIWFSESKEIVAAAKEWSKEFLSLLCVRPAFSQSLQAVLHTVSQISPEQLEQLLTRSAAAGTSEPAAQEQA